MAKLVLLLCLSPCCFLDFAWRWTDDAMPVDFRGQMIWFDECLSGPLYFPCYDPETHPCGGACLDRFDTDGNGHVDMKDYAELQRMSG